MREDSCNELRLISARAHFNTSNLEARLLMDCDAWNSHEWSAQDGRQVEIEAGKPLIQRHCTRCKRNFVENIASGERHAVYVSMFSFRKLPDSTTKQWLVDLCPGAPPSYDVEVRNRSIEHRVK
jgi:hypothetical protein